MKECPKCGQTFNDDSLGFCLMDGTALVATESQPTIVIDRTVAVPKKKNTGLWVGLIIVVMLFGIIAVAGGLMLFLGNRGDDANASKGTVNGSIPSKTTTPKPTPTRAAASPTPNIEASSTQSKDQDADEIVPIAWNTAASTFKSDPGLIYKFQCPEGGTAEAIWGSDIYSADSSICTAAVHAGIITLDQGGVVTVEFRPGRPAYGSTVRNGITSNNYGENAHSFVVR